MLYGILTLAVALLLATAYAVNRYVLRKHQVGVYVWHRGINVFTPKRVLFMRTYVSNSGLTIAHTTTNMPTHRHNKAVIHHKHKQLHQVRIYVPRIWYNITGTAWVATGFGIAGMCIYGITCMHVTGLVFALGLIAAPSILICCCSIAYRQLTHPHYGKNRHTAWHFNGK
jgi:hypothetical protein